MKIFRLTGIMILVFMITGLTSLRSQEISFTASSKTLVQEGEQFRLTYTLTAQGTNFRGPAFSGFRVMSGPNQSTSQSYQIINGRVSQSFQLTFTYILMAQKEGEYEIPPATVSVDGKDYTSNSLKINVKKASQPSQQGGQSGRRSPSQSEGLAADDVFIKAFIDKKNPMQGEQVIITYKIFTTVPISQINIEELSSFPGFWIKDLLDQNESLKQYNEVLNGKEYVVADLKKIAIFPQRSGELQIEPMVLQCLAQVRTQSSSRFRDPFFDQFFDDPIFNTNVQNVPLNLSSNAITLNVKPLPGTGRPADFSGAVGNFTMDVNIDRTRLKVNEAITIKVHIAGKGNIELIEPLRFNFPPDFETYDPKITGNTSKNQSGISGTRIFEYLVIPRTSGNFHIKPVNFSFFDLSKGVYTLLPTPEFNIVVEKGEDDGTSNITYSGVSQKDIEYIGSDIRYLKSYPFTLMKANTFFFRSTTFFLLIIIPLLLAIFAILIIRNQVKRQNNVGLMRYRKANKIARQNLRKASEFLQKQEKEEFFIEVSRALWGYLSHKFNIPLSELSLDTIEKHLAKNEVSEETSTGFLQTLNECEFARFAPGDSSQQMQQIYDKALNIISKIEHELR